MHEMSHPPHIAVLAFNGISPFHLAVPGLIFGEDRAAAGVPVHDYRVCSAEGPRLELCHGLHLDLAHGLNAAAEADIVIVPSWRDPGEPPPPAMLSCLRDAMDRGAIIVGLCLGAFPLAAAGCLHGLRATTHWAHIGTLRRLCPSAQVEPDVLYVDAGNVVTSAGVAAGLDCCLHVLRRLHGAEIARIVARHTVLAPHRQGGQAQFIDPSPDPGPQRDRLDAAIAFARENLGRRLSLDMLADRAGLSRRTFSRHFRQRHGTSFGAWLSRERIAAAQRLLETTGLPVESVAAGCGFGTAAALRQQFAAVLKTNPTTYRRQFAGAPHAISAD